MSRPRKPLGERFWSNVTKTKNCWIWKGYTHPTGYGAIHNGSSMIGAHRLSYIINKGKIPNGLCVLHHCDNPGCVNPNHLWLGTRGDNNTDRKNKNRSACGESNPKSKLQKNQVIRIFRSYDKTDKELAEKYSVSQQTISCIRTGRSWSHVTKTL